jgi:alkanesulfonate monooxygenase SsuD/methylene tetrahydromethanopterin reductase-like flavin-dependent oxidoreductase (luciferase family)
VRSIHLGTAVICLNLHHPIDVAEQVAVADLLTGGRLAPGFGSGSAPREPEFFGQPEMSETQRHARFEEALRIIRAAWSGNLHSDDLKHFSIRPHQPLPIPENDLRGRCWIAANSAGAAHIAGTHGFNMLFSHLRTPDQHREYASAYRSAGGKGLIAQNRPIFVGPTDAEAFDAVEPALRILWRRFQYEGKIPAEMAEPSSIEDLSAHPINFIVGGPETAAERILALHRKVPFDVLNAEVRWAGLPHPVVCDSLRRLSTDVMTIISRKS